MTNVFPVTARRLMLFLLLTSTCLSPTVFAETALVPYVATYTLDKKTATIAEATFRLQRQSDNGHWSYNSHAEAKGLAALFTDEEITESSRLEIVDGRIVPLEYRFKRGPAGDNNPEKWQIQYRWKDGTAHISDSKGESKQIALQQPSFDTLTLQLALIQAAREGRKQISVHVIDDGVLEQQDFELGGRETVRTPMGEYEAIKIIRRHGKRETITWFAPKLNYIPVKIRGLRNNKFKSELNIISAKFN